MTRHPAGTPDKSAYQVTLFPPKRQSPVSEKQNSRTFTKIRADDHALVRSSFPIAPRIMDLKLVPLR